VIFKIASDSTYSVLYNFCQKANCADGATPQAPPTLDRAGNLYGTTAQGGVVGYPGYGVVFELSPNGKETVLYAFCEQYECADGYSPTAPVTLDSAGNVYGTTYCGGIWNGENCAYGVTFKIAPAGTR
jgi:uncharacterized repeat protein (TIGR03803 family)